MSKGKGTSTAPPPAKIRKLSAAAAPPPLENPTSPTSTHRSSFSSSPERDRAARAAAAATTPKRTPKSPFRSLRTRLRSFGLGSSSPSAAAGAAASTSSKRPASLGSRPASAGKDGWATTRRSVRGKTVSGPVSVIPGGAARLKGYQGPAGNRPNAALTAAAAEAAAGTVGRSVSLPANLAARATRGGGGGGDDDGADFDEQRRRVDEVLPALLWRARSGKSQGGTEYGSGGVTEFGALGRGGTVSPLSVDEFLAAQIPFHSPPLVSPTQTPVDDEGTGTDPPPRGPKPALRPIRIPPRATTSTGLSPNPPSSIARFLRSPTPEQPPGEAENPSSTPTLSNPRPPLMPPRISSDFVRHSAGPSLSALRARQVAETEAIARDLAARDPSHRNSRILPGATLPIDWATQTLVRSKTMGAVVAVPDRWSDPYVVEGSSNGGGGKGSSSQGSSSLRRSSSDSPLLPQSDVMLNAIAVAGGRQGENERGFSLGRVAGRRRQPAMINYKTHGRTASVPTTRNERAAEGRHPDSEDSPFKQPFPSEFEEVPFRQANNFRPSSLSTADEQANLPMSPSTPATPLMPQIVEASPPPSTAPGSPNPGSSKPSSNAADENGKSPLMDMIEQLQAHPTSRNDSVFAPFGGGGAFRGSSAGRQMFTREYAAAAAAEDAEDAMENLDDGAGSPYEEEDEYRYRDRNTSTQSEAGYPFPLAGYLDSAAPSRSASTDAGQVHPGPPAYLAKLPSHAGHPAPTVRSPPPPTPTSDRDDGFFLRSPLGASSGSAFVRASFDSPDRSIAMEQMEREIAQMEAELAASGTPRSLYDSPYLSSIRSPVVGDEEPESPSPPGSRITPRSAKRWSLIEMERAYERMKNLLASSNERQRSRSHDERAFGLDSVPEVLAAQDSPSVAARTDGGASREGERPDQASFSPKPSALRERRLADQRDHGGVPLGESGGPLTVVANKPLPGLPAPSPRKPVHPNNHAKPSGLSVPLSDAGHASLSGSERAVETPAAAQQEEAEAANEAVDVPEPEASTSPTRAAAAEPAPEQRGNLGNLAHRRTGSESRIRQLYLPLRHKSTRDSMLSVAGIDDMLSELGSPVTEVAPKRSSGLLETTTTTPPPPLSPSHEQRLPTSARSSRFGRYELRSGAGRELQRRLGHENNAPPVEPLSPMRKQPPVVRQVSSRLSSSRLQRAAGELSAEEGNRQTGEGSTDGGVTTWYPISPGRDRPLQLSSDGSESHGTVSTGYDNGRRRRRRSSEKPRGVPARPALSVARVRTMDKLELYLEYVAIRSDLEKAELERAAVFDALRETRAVLADVRRQRDAAEKELQILRAAGPPDASPIDSTHAWRERAQQALCDVEILRHELLESRAREQDAAPRGGASGAPPSSSRRSRSRSRSASVAGGGGGGGGGSTVSSSELSRTGGATTTTVTMQQGPFPSASGETRAQDRDPDHADGGPGPSSSSEAHGRSPLSVDDDDAAAGTTTTARRAPKDSFASSSLDSQFTTTTTTNSDAPTNNNVDGSSSSNGGGARNRLSALSLFHGSDFVSPLMNQTMNFIVGGLGSSGGRRDSVVDLEREAAKSSFGSGTGASEASSPLKGRSSSAAAAVGFSGEATTTTTRRSAATLMGRSLSALGFPGHGHGPPVTSTSADGDPADEEDVSARAGAKMSTSTAGTTTTTTTTSSSGGGGDWSLESTTLVNPEQDHFEDGGLLQDPAAARRRRQGGNKKWLRSRDEAFLSDLTTAPPSLGLGSAVDVDHGRGQEERED